MTWRDKFRPLIAEVIQRTGKDDEKKLRRALVSRYKEMFFSIESGHLYRIWCDEINVQLGKRKFGARSRIKVPADPAQQTMF